MSQSPPFAPTLLHSQTAAFNGGRHLYSAGRPSRWALAHISSCILRFGETDGSVTLANLIIGLARATSHAVKHVYSLRIRYAMRQKSSALFMDTV